MSDEYYPDLQGWLSEDEGKELQKLARGKRVLEIGCWKARSTIIMGLAAKEVFSIDHFQGDDFTGEAHQTFKEAWDNVLRYELQDKIRLIVSPFIKVFPLLKFDSFGFIFYDAGHHYEETARSLHNIAFWVNDNCPIAVHDYKPGEEIWKPTVKAVDEVVETHKYKMRLVGSLAILEK